jgi:carbon monoxide dehydrogenase subunit G
MEFADAITLSATPARTWETLVDFRRIAACVPGCEDVEEVEPLARYRAMMRQRVGPFRLDVPLEIEIEGMTPGESSRARARGRDKLTQTAVNATLGVALAPEGGGTRLSFVTDLQVTGRVAALGHSVIKRRSEENFAEFARRLRALLEGA